MASTLAGLAGCGGASEPTSSSETSATEDTTPSGAESVVDSGLQDMIPQEISDRGVLRVGVSAPLPPFVLFESEGSDDLTGMDVELAKAFAERAGLEIEFRKYDFAGLIAALQAGQVDVLWSGLLPSADRLEVADFVVYFRNPFGILVAEGNPENIQEVIDLCGKSVALLQGSTPPRLIVEDRQAQCAETGQEPIETVTYPDRESTQLAIRSGKVDAEIGAGALAAYTAETADDGQGFDYAIDDEGLGGVVDFPDGVAVLKGEEELLDAVRVGVQILIDDGSYTAVLESYGLEDFAVEDATINELD